MLLDAVVEHLAKRGLGDLSLRALAAAAGTSHRMLLYYFGTKEQLLAEVYRALRRRTMGSMADAVAGGATGVEIGVAVWRAMADDPQRLRLSGELAGLGLLHPDEFAAMAAEHVDALVQMTAHMFRNGGLGEARAQALGTLVIGAMRGLQLDLLMTGDRERTEAAFMELADAMRAALALGTKP